MKKNLFLLLAVVAAVLIWAFWTGAYSETSIFTLGIAATGMCGYLIADYLFNIKKRTWAEDSNLLKTEITTLKEEKSNLQKHIAAETPQVEIDTLRNRLNMVDQENKKLNGDYLAQTAELASTKTKLERITKEYSSLKEDSTLSTASSTTEMESIRDTLVATKTKLSELGKENEDLKSKLAQQQESQPKVIVKSRIKTVEHIEENPKVENTEGVRSEDSGSAFVNKEKESDAPKSSHRRKSRSIDFDDEEQASTPVTQVVENQPVKPKKEVEKNVILAEKAPQSSPHPMFGNPDDLKVIEGIGPKIEMILKEAGILNWQMLSEVTVENLKGVLEKAGSQYRMNDPTTWPEQARLLSNGEYEKFKQYTDYLVGGKAPKG